MGVQNDLARVYCRQVGKELVCSRKIRNRILRELQGNVDLFLEQRPDAAMGDVQEHFGTPRQIANSYLTEMDSTELLQKFSLKKKIVIAVCAALAACVLIWGIAVGIALRMAQEDSTNLNIETYIEEAS